MADVLWDDEQRGGLAPESRYRIRTGWLNQSVGPVLWCAMAKAAPARDLMDVSLPAPLLAVRPLARWRWLVSPVTGR